jgi:hypothetical protein
MPAASTLPGAQLLSSATFRAQIRDSQSTPAYLFSRATVFNHSRNPRQKLRANGLNPMFTYGAYWILKTDQFQVELPSAPQTFTSAVESVSGSTLVPGPRPELSLEELVSRTKPAVVFLKSSRKGEPGFLLPLPASSPQTHIGTRRGSFARDFAEWHSTGSQNCVCRSRP